MRVERTYIAEDGKKFETPFACMEYEQEVERKKEEEERRETKRLSDSFLISVGFNVNAFGNEEQMRKALNLTWLVFDENGNVKGLKTCGGGLLERHGIPCDFRYIAGSSRRDPEIMENWLRRNKWYAHALSSFAERKQQEFYRMDLLGKLQCLGWDVKGGKLVNNMW